MATPKSWPRPISMATPLGLLLSNVPLVKKRKKRSTSIPNVNIVTVSISYEIQTNSLRLLVLQVEKYCFIISHEVVLKSIENNLWRRLHTHETAPMQMCYANISKFIFWDENVRNCIAAWALCGYQWKPRLPPPPPTLTEWWQYRWCVLHCVVAFQMRTWTGARMYSIHDHVNCFN